MISLLVVDGTGRLADELRLQLASIEHIEIFAAKDPVEAIGVIEEHDITGLAVNGRCSDTDPLAITTWVMRFKPDLKLIFVTDDPTPAPSKIVSLSPGPVFVNVHDLGLQLGLILGGNEGSVRPRTAIAVDALDVTRIAGLQSSSGAAQIFAGSKSGTLRFEDGVLVHAASGSVIGTDAFFSMMLWPRGDIQRLSAEEADACVTNVWFPSAFLFQEAERFRDVLQGEGDDPEVGSDGGCDGVETKTDREAVWRNLARAYPSGVRVVVACSNRCEGSCFRKTLTEMGDSLGADAPWLSESSDGPSFARVHSGSGGTLAMTRVPLTRRHEYLFETLSKSAEVTLLCGEVDPGRVEAIRRRSSQSLVVTIGGDELTSADLWGVLEQMVDSGSAG